MVLFNRSCPIRKVLLVTKNGTAVSTVLVCLIPSSETSIFVSMQCCLRLRCAWHCYLAGNNKIEGRWTAEDSDTLRGSLAKAVYEKLFLWIIQALNSTIEPQGGFQTFMGRANSLG